MDASIGTVRCPSSITWRDVAIVSLLTAAIYFWRLGTIPICGEEPRWACGAVQMLETGDWIVPRQQGQVFPERPPMSSWAMALAALVRGEMDALAVRLPSCLAIVANVCLITLYSGQFLSRLGAVAAGLIYATFGQVMQIGRMGESEALFTLFLSSAILCWHAGYCLRFSPNKIWILGYSLAALAALVKGIQAPIYFLAITNGYLVYRRDWRGVVHIGQILGWATFALIVGCWQVPFYWQTDWPSVKAIWWGLAGDRLTLNGLLSHLVSYPFETLGCLAPWPVLAVFLLLPDVRRAIGAYRQLLTFLAIAILVTYPSVWFASLARGRYFMPLYPLMAVALATIVDCCATASASQHSRIWWFRIVKLTGLGAFVAAVVVVLIRYVSPGLVSFLSVPSVAVLAVVGSITGIGLWWMSGHTSGRMAMPAFFTFVSYLGLTYTTVLVDYFTGTWNNPQKSVLAVRSRIAHPEKLVSFGPADHRFVYFYGPTIPELPWPLTAEQVPDSVEYFCFDFHQGDTAERRANGRGRSWTTTTGTLPFQWEEVAVVNCERRPYRHPSVVTIIGRIVSRESRVADIRTEPVSME